MGGKAGLLPHLDAVCELGQVFDDLSVLCGLHLQQLLDDDHGLCHHELWAPGNECVGPRAVRRPHAGGRARLQCPWTFGSLPHPPCTPPVALRDIATLRR